MKLLKSFWDSGVIQSIVYPSREARVFDNEGREIHRGQLKETGQFSCGKIETILTDTKGRLHYFYLDQYWS